MRQVHVQAGPFAGLAIALLAALALVAGVMLAGILAIVLGLSTLPTRIARRLWPRRREHRAASPGKGVVIEGSYVVVSEKTAPAPTVARHGASQASVGIGR